MALLIGWSTVVLPLWVDCHDLFSSRPAHLSICGKRELTVGAGGCAAIGVVTELVDVDATLGIGIVTGEVP